MLNFKIINFITYFLLLIYLNFITKKKQYSYLIKYFINYQNENNNHKNGIEPIL